MRRASSRTMIFVAIVDCGSPISSLISLTFFSPLRRISRIRSRTSEARPFSALKSWGSWMIMIRPLLFSPVIESFLS